ncbi:non-specific serine/threonine protein kinase OS=Streptomyces griseomycini OX=66895 GN=FHS37_000351 PE=4 SV=1 [Streptomyces griseomycini]
MLTGTKPHDGDSPAAVLYKHLHEDVPPPSASVPGIA